MRNILYYDQFISHLVDDDCLFIQDDSMDVKSISLQSISIDFIPEDQLLWVSCYFICLKGQIKVYYRIKRVVIN